MTNQPPRQKQSGIRASSDEPLTESDKAHTELDKLMDPHRLVVDWRKINDLVWRVRYIRRSASVK